MAVWHDPYCVSITPQRCVQPVCKGGWGEGERGGTGIHGYTGLEEGGLLTIPVPWYCGDSGCHVAVERLRGRLAYDRWEEESVHPKGESTYCSSKAARGD